MTWRAELQSLFSSYGMDAYVEGNVPDDTAFPYLTYTLNRGDFGDSTNSVLHLHYYSESESAINAKADEICDDMRIDHTVVCNEGRLVLTTGSPEWYAIFDEDRLHKHRAINITINWFLRR